MTKLAGLDEIRRLQTRSVTSRTSSTVRRTAVRNRVDRQTRKFWLMKTEPDGYSIDDLKRDKKTPWSGVRNYQARNFMMQMGKGDLVLFYHSSCTPTGVYGIGKVANAAHPDETQFDAKSQYFDPKATKEKPIWWCVDVAFVKKFKSPITLEAIKFEPKLEGMRVRERGSRLSVQPVSPQHFRHIIESMV